MCIYTHIYVYVVVCVCIHLCIYIYLSSRGRCVRLKLCLAALDGLVVRGQAGLGVCDGLVGGGGLVVEHLRLALGELLLGRHRRVRL